MRSGAFFFQLTELSEEKIINLLWKRFGFSSNGRDPFGDDVAWTGVKDEMFLVSKSDMFVSSSDAPTQMNARQMAMKSITACVSDMASKGVRPSYCMISLGLPRRLANASFVSGLGRGFASALKLYDVRVLGGDTGVSSDVVINCAMYGFSNRIVRRSGAHLGDCVGVTGGFGLEPAGLLLLQGKAKSSNKSFSRRAIRSVLEPRARLSEGLRLAKYLSSSIDSSDGLAISLHYLAEASSVSIELDSIPFASGVREFSSENSIDPEALAFFGGEEYEIVCTFPESLSKVVESLDVSTIGRVVKRKDSSLYYEKRKVKRKGWMHFVSD